LKIGANARSLFFQNLAGRFLRAKPSQHVKRRREAMRQLERRLNSLGPKQVLARGYSITTDAVTGKVLREAVKVKAGQKLKTQLKAGELFSRVEK
jgi:exodeoxyribonuclease VII large subunit